MTLYQIFLLQYIYCICDATIEDICDKYPDFLIEVLQL